ncbi:PIG-L deacetylase family protein [Pengzhenrongella frigida]|uniref:PIG-L family deacetylase n=1 Tax=Pengzhenrongella frigida TaxID=1259133 RepID=A0A4Q5MYL9_9MICO|nr:PIG-L family deacetylase [Cellulomonas sp. HLT2-17]RYV50756.1 PIG-L family deacetylase [Cellulomonas sp. HLT2-17]
MGLGLPPGPLRVVCLAAHPDDVEIACGGTILELMARPDSQLSWLTLTGSPEREAEAREAAAAFSPGSTSTFVGLPDGRLPARWAEVQDAMHGFAKDTPVPDLVLAPSKDDAHQDHRLIGSLASTVWRDSLVLHYEIPKWDGDLGRPNVYLPVSEENARRKVRHLDECYPSQRDRDWWDEELFLGLMRVRGVECRSRYAEAFVVSKSVLRIGAGA